MARATKPRAKSLARNQDAKTARPKTAKPAPETVKAVRSNSSKSAPARRTTATPAVSATSKEELRARIEKLERANSTLRVKNKELRLAYVETAEKVDALTTQLEAAERRAARGTGGTARRRGGASAAAEEAEDHALAADPVTA